MQRQFSAQAANQVWLADITEHRTDEGKLYLCAIKDVHSNRIVGYSIDSRMKSTLAVDALDHAVALRSPVATIVHSDRGSQFRSRNFSKSYRALERVATIMNGWMRSMWWPERSVSLASCSQLWFGNEIRNEKR